jgi:NAD(P)-dependent dehydrogenase (short-subunit alcohol dehydrogenase family)
MALAAGHNVVATARNPDDMAALGDERTAKRLVTTRLDVEDPKSIADAVELATETFGAIDVLVSNAGVGMIGAVEETTPDEVGRIFGVNVMGTLNVIRGVLPVMRARRRGRIVVISSAGGVYAAPTIGVYFASKHALEGLLEAMRAEITPLGVTCHLIEPGLTRTGMRSRGMPPPSRPIADYDFIRIPRLEVLEQPYPEGTTTPEQVGQAIIDLMARAEPGFRLPVGKDTHGRVQQKIDDLSAALRLGAEMGTTT